MESNFKIYKINTNTMTIEDAFVKLITLEWESLPKNFRDKYRPARSKFKNRRGSVGIGMMIEMLELQNKKVIVEE